MSVTDTTISRLGIGMLLTGCFLAGPVVSANPYSEISDRNIFRLKDPPPDTPPVIDIEPDPLPNVIVTGITTVMGVERALIKVVTPADPKTKTPAAEASYIMVAGGPPMGGVQVLAVKDDPDPKEVKVKVRQRGKESWLPLEKDKVAVAAAKKPTPGAVPGKPVPAQLAAQKLAAARAAASRATAGGIPQPVTPGALPNRNVRSAQAGMPGTPGYAPGLAAGATQGGIRRNRVFQARDQVGDLTPEEQIILIEANRLETIEGQASGLVPPPPSTVLTPDELNPTTPIAPQDPLDPLLPGYP